MKDSNGYVRIKLHGFRGEVEKELTQRARITAKLIKTSTRTWDHSGVRKNRYFSGMKQTTLIAFAKDGEQETIL